MYLPYLTLLFTWPRRIALILDLVPRYEYPRAALGLLRQNTLEYTLLKVEQNKVR